MQLTHVVHPDQLHQFCTLPGAATLRPELPAMQEADAHWAVYDDQNQILARCSLWWTRVPVYPAQRLGLVGHYAAHDNHAARLLLDHAVTQLALQQCTMAVGPMDGNTFRHYRFVTQRTIGDTLYPTFFLEPDNPDSWPSQFLAAGFQPLAHYFSAIGSLPEQDPTFRCALIPDRRQRYPDPYCECACF